MSFPTQEQLDVMEAHELMALLNGVLLESESVKQKLVALKDLKKKAIQDRRDASIALLGDKGSIEAQTRKIQAQAMLDVLKVEMEQQKDIADACKLQSSILQTSINTQVRLAR